MTATLTHSKKKILLQIDPEQLENFLDIGGFYDANFLEILKKSDKEIRLGRVTKRKSLMDILRD